MPSRKGQDPLHHVAVSAQQHAGGTGGDERPLMRMNAVLRVQRDLGDRDGLAPRARDQLIRRGGPAKTTIGE
jgi:hypothetical protein